MMTLTNVDVSPGEPLGVCRNATDPFLTRNTAVRTDHVYLANARRSSR